VSSTNLYFTRKPEGISREYSVNPHTNNRAEPWSVIQINEWIERDSYTPHLVQTTAIYLDEEATRVLHAALTKAVAKFDEERDDA
jgi:hypothetical protein